ncbi:hypothetical protein LX66_3663 [Chitinophaga japonensis]|uniref:Uncharacterized protein n=2 Tax=Chitinophaga japonensis TaxID=104662 RepID=A0A562SZZ7_CHIJA|nr:hypothetical protein LX66_3663 [Chitinophaga japonensis]
MITRDRRGLGEIIKQLQASYESVPVARGFIINKALRIWRVNNQGRTWEQEIAFTMKNFDNDGNVERANGEVMQHIQENNEEGFWTALKVTTALVNEVQRGVPHYPYKSGADRNVYGETEKGIPSTVTTAWHAARLREKLQQQKVWKYKGDNSSYKGYMIGVAADSNNRLYAAFSGQNEPRTAGRDQNFTRIAQMQQLRVFNTQFTVLEDFRNKVATVQQATLSKHRDSDNHEYDVVEDISQAGAEKGRAALASCAGAKLAGVVPVMMTEVFVAPDDSTVTIKDQIGRDRRYNNRSESVPSCLNCQFMIPYIQDKKSIGAIPVGELEAEEVHRTVTSAVSHLRDRQEVNNLDVAPIIEAVVRKFPGGHQREYGEEIREHVLEIVDANIRAFNELFLKDPDEAVRQAPLEMGRKILRTEKERKEFMQVVNEKRREEKERKKKEHRQKEPEKSKKAVPTPTATKKVTSRDKMNKKKSHRKDVPQPARSIPLFPVAMVAVVIIAAIIAVIIRSFA